MNTIILNNISDEDLRLLLTLAERLAWDMRLLPDMTQDETETEEETDPQYAGKSYDELLEILLEKRMKEEMIPAQEAEKSIEAELLKFRKEKYGEKI